MKKRQEGNVNGGCVYVMKFYKNCSGSNIWAIMWIYYLKR